MAENRILMAGNEAIAEGAIQAGLEFYAGYPITPQNELTAYMAEQMPLRGKVFIQAEAEVAAINMIFGASAAGVRAMTSSSSPGISLKQEGISYMAGCRLPGVIVNMMRAGPGLGSIAPSQSDYFQATKGGGHGDYHMIVLAPHSAQECYDIMFNAFDLADAYRSPVMILGDGMLGQMMEPVAFNTSKTARKTAVAKPWALTGCVGRPANVIRSLLLKDGALEGLNQELQAMYQKIQKKEQRWEEVQVDDAQVILVAYGIMARVAKNIVSSLRAKGVRIGLIRPITLWPFPVEAFINRRSPRLKYLVVEMSYGQMVEDVRLALECKSPVAFLGRAGGGMPTEQEIVKKIKAVQHG
ncbi:MAG: 3-methyl-2-oxobutanoate dehydrogenase subunit VorB [Candidatus Omnitrophota bacterium]